MKKLLFILCLLVSCLDYNTGQATFKNGFQIEIGYSGGDGIFPTPLYGLTYKKSIFNRLDGYLKYAQSRGSDRQFVGTLDERFILGNDNGESAKTRFSQFTSVGLGLEIQIVKIKNSNLHLIVGGRYLKTKNSQPYGWSFTSEGEVTISDYSPFQNRGIAYEFGVGYTRIFKEKFTIGGDLYYISMGSRITGSLNLGVLF